MEVFRGLKVLGGRSGSIQRSEGEGWEEWKYSLVGRKKVVDGPSGHYNSMCIITVNDFGYRDYNLFVVQQRIQKILNISEK